MDWKECLKKRTVKEVKIDKNLITSSREIASIKMCPESLFLIMDFTLLRISRISSYLKLILITF